MSQELKIADILIGEKIDEIKIYRRRWAIVFITMLYNMGTGFDKAYFGQVNDVYSQYFGVSLTDTDWLTVGIAPVSMLSCVVLAWLASTREVCLRKLCLTQCSMIAIGFTAVFIGCSFRIFAVTLCGQVLLGIPAAVGMVSLPLVAVTWFSPEETGVAMGLNFAGFSLGMTIGFFLPSRILQVSDEENDVESTLHNTKLITMAVFGSLCALFYLLLLATYFVVFNRPLHPPSKAEAIKRIKSEEKNSNIRMKNKSRKKEIWKSLIGFLQQTKKLISNTTYLKIVLSFALSFSNDTISFILLSDVMSSKGEDLLGTLTAESASGLAMTVFGVGHIVGGVIGGKLIDYTRRYKFLACMVALCQFLATVTVTVSILLPIFHLLYVGAFFFGVGTMSTILAITEVACQHMHPTSVLLVNSWLIVSGQLLATLLPLLFRVALVNFGYKPTVILQSGILGIGLISLLFAKPTYHRLRINSSQQYELKQCTEL